MSTDVQLDIYLRRAGFTPRAKGTQAMASALQRRPVQNPADQLAVVGGWQEPPAAQV
jgi:hypothetical protein